MGFLRLLLDVAIAYTQLSKIRGGGVSDALVYASYCMGCPGVNSFFSYPKLAQRQQHVQFLCSA